MRLSTDLENKLYTVVAITIRYIDTFEQHRWESSAVDADGHFFCSPAIKPATLLDRLGGGDTWKTHFSLIEGESRDSF